MTQNTSDVSLPTSDGIVLDERQIEAIDLCINSKSRIVGVRGAAGTGKTLLERYVHEALTNAGNRVALAAPTGKASKRIEESTGLPASTMHRLLEFGMPAEDEDTGKPVGVSLPNRHARRPLAYDVIMCDEYSMVNSQLHAALTDAMAPGSRLLVFGDTNQLRPIEDTYIPGQRTAFETLLQKFPSVTLTQVHRQGKDSGIISNAHRVLKRMAPIRNDDFELRITDKQVDSIRDIVGNDHEWASVRNQIITPMNKTAYGTHALNGMIQTLLEPDTGLPTIQLPRHKWEEKLPVFVRVGTKVIQTKNNYNLGVFNGETGVVVTCDPSTKMFSVDFGDRIVEYPHYLMVDMLDPATGRPKTLRTMPQRDVQLAYAITTHKSQGSEFDNVMYVMSRSMSFGQNRANLYTGITRAKKHVLLISDTASLTSVPLKEE